MPARSSIPWILAVGRGLKIGAMAGMIAPYPTYGEVGKRAAGAFYTAEACSGRAPDAWFNGSQNWDKSGLSVGDGLPPEGRERP